MTPRDEARARIESACASASFAADLTLKVHVNSVMAMLESQGLYSAAPVCYATTGPHPPQGG